MARPGKYRRVCEVPEHRAFGPRPPRRSLEPVNLTVDEYEVLRLMDYEGLNQAETAEQMNVARSTVQRIYNIARKKLMMMMVEGRDLHIEGGNFKICDGSSPGRGCGHGQGQGRCGRHGQNR